MATGNGRGTRSVEKESILEVDRRWWWKLWKTHVCLVLCVKGQLSAVYILHIKLKGITGNHQEKETFGSFPVVPAASLLWVPVPWNSHFSSCRLGLSAQGTRRHLQRSQTLDNRMASHLRNEMVPDEKLISAWRGWRAPVPKFSPVMGV